LIWKRTAFLDLNQSSFKVACYFSSEPQEVAMVARETKHDRAIRLRAERMWHDDGCPAGRMDEYLERARELQAIVENPSAGLLPNPMTARHRDAEQSRPVEEAELMDNLGEFPGLLSDQGDHVLTPMTRRKARRFVPGA
jgi:hypothetical protein